jgi:hypothetical protein
LSEPAGAPAPAHAADALAAIPARPWWAALGACALGTTLFALAAPHAPLPVHYASWAAIVAFALAFGWVAAEVLAVAALTPRLSPRALGLSLTLALPLVALGVLAPGPSIVATAGVAALLLGAGTSAGAALGERIQHAGHLGVVAYVSSLADLVSVLHESGPSAQILESAPTLAVLAVGAPMAGTPDLSPILGIGDVVFVALYLAAARKHGLPFARTVAALAVGLALTFVVVVALARPIPALPFLGLGVVLAHPRAWLPPPHERRQALVGVLVFTALAAWLWLR